MSRAPGPRPRRAAERSEAAVAAAIEALLDAPDAAARRANTAVRDEDGVVARVEPLRAFCAAPYLRARPHPGGLVRRRRVARRLPRKGRR